MKTPGSEKCRAPLTRNCVAKSVFPDPALPQTKVARPRGSPPKVISSKPSIPVADLESPTEVPGWELSFALLLDIPAFRRLRAILSFCVETSSQVKQTMPAARIPERDIAALGGIKRALTNRHYRDQEGIN